MNEVRNILVGMEIGETSAQIAYYDRKGKEPVSVPIKVGTNLYVFPVQLVKMPGRDEWHFGYEAEYFAKERGGIVCPNPVGTAISGQSVVVDGTEMAPDELLAIFIKESLSLLGVPLASTTIGGICVTCGGMTGNLALTVMKALTRIGFKKEVCFVADLEESFYYYCYSMKPEIRARSMGLIRFSGNEASFSRIHESKSGRSFVVTISDAGQCVLPEEKEERDAAFAEAVGSWTNGVPYSGIFITGEGFGTDWAKESVRALSRAAAHVFEGDNLFVKGACWAVCEQLERHAFKNRVYFGPDHIRSDVGIDVIENGQQQFLPLITAGTSYYLCETECDIILDGRDDLLVTVRFADSAAHRNEKLMLEGLPDRPPRTTRLHLTLTCPSVSECVLTAEDLGFGELFPATHKTYTMKIGLEREEEIG